MSEVLGDAGSPAVGAAEPQVTVVLFTDYRCPICRATDPALLARLAQDPTLRVIFKDWPILGELSHAAARAALAAARQGRYLAAHRALMSSGRALDASGIDRALRAAGVDGASLERDLRVFGADIEAQLRRHARQAFALGLQGTPAYLIGPWLIRGGLEERQLQRAIRRARHSAPLQP